MQINDIQKISYLEKSDFHTHLNYARRMAVICKGMSITTNIEQRRVAQHIAQFQKEIERFARLSEMTAKSIASDWQYSKEDIAYSSICAPWIPVKCYYRIYYLEAIFLCLKGHDNGYRTDGHHKVRSVLNAELFSGTIKYNTPLNSLGVLEINECMNFPSISRHANIRKDFWKEEACTKAMLRLLARYMFENWKRDKNLYTLEGKAQRDSFLVRYISIFDYAYQMRLKANYKDMNFLDPDKISPDDAHAFIKSYLIFYLEYSKALINIISHLYPEGEKFLGRNF